MGGLAVQYLEHKSRTFDSDRLSVSVPDKGVKLEGLAFRVVSDRSLAKMPDGRMIHNCCIEFKNLGAYQNFQIENFIANHTHRPAGERRSGNERRRFEDPRFQDEQYRLTFERRGASERRTNWPPS